MKMFAIIETTICPCCNKQTVKEQESKEIKNIDDFGTHYINCPQCSFPIKQILKPVSELKAEVFQSYLNANEEYNEALEDFLYIPSSTEEMEKNHHQVKCLRETSNALFQQYLEISY